MNSNADLALVAFPVFSSLFRRIGGSEVQGVHWQRGLTPSLARSRRGRVSEWLACGFHAGERQLPVAQGPYVH